MACIYWTLYSKSISHVLFLRNFSALKTKKFHISHQVYLAVELLYQRGTLNIFRIKRACFETKPFLLVSNLSCIETKTMLYRDQT